jgi:hypothetical protein
VARQVQQPLTRRGEQSGLQRRASTGQLEQENGAFTDVSLRR